MRANLLTPRQKLWLAPTTGDAVQAACKKYGLTLSSELVPSQTANVPSATLHTISVTHSEHSSSTTPLPSEDETVVLYLHGGGYIYGLRADGVLPLIMRFTEAARAHRVYLLEYAVAPGLKYPGQLAQAAATLSLLIGKKRVKAENIIIIGDSAGAHLALSLLAHLQQPHPDIKPVAEFSSTGSGTGKTERPKLKAALLLSPWVSMNTDTPSYAQNEGVDMITKAKVQVFIDSWKPRKDEIWAELLANDGQPPPADRFDDTRVAFWRGLPVRKVFSTIGDWEVFLDGAREMHALLVEAGVDAELVEGTNEIHVQPVVDTALKVPDSETITETLKWLNEL